MLMSISHLEKSFQGQSVLKNITFQVDNHDKIAIIGMNGAGKSTLLRIIQNEESYDSGTLSIPNNVKIGYLSQHNEFDQQLSLYDTLMLPYQEIIQIEKRMRELEYEMGQTNHLEEILKEYDHLQNEFNKQNGYQIESNVKGLLKGLGFEESKWNHPVSTLSGGQKTRIALGKLLLSEPDLLLLDEPTNHLDLESIGWLEEYLKGYNKALIVVSHDRYFIDEVTNKIVEIENGKSTLYKCKYSEYAAIKKHNREIEMKHYINNQKEIKRMQESIDLLKSFGREKQVKRAESKEKMLSKMEKVDKPENINSQMKLTFKPEIESGFDVLSVKDLEMAFDRPLFKNITFDIHREDRVAIVGKNGIGKSTLFHLILGDYLPINGKIKKGVKVTYGYYDQEHRTLNESKTIFDEIHDTYPQMTNTEVRNVCARFLFTGEEVLKPISVLSGGERGRVVLMKLLLQKANFLLLDEPTNHLDIESKEILEDALLDFPGTILFISHDRYFINKLSTHILEMHENGLIKHDGNYTSYIETKKEKIDNPVSENKINNVENKKLRNQIKKLEQSISELENEIALKNEQLAIPEIINDYIKYNELTDEIEKLNKDLEDLYENWEELQS